MERKGMFVSKGVFRIPFKLKYNKYRPYLIQNCCTQERNEIDVQQQ